MSEFARWYRDRVPVLWLLVLPGFGELVVGVARGGPLGWTAWAVGLALVLIAGGGAVLLETGWIDSPRELWTVTVGTLRRRRRTIEQQAAVLQSLVVDLRESSMEEAARMAGLLAELVRAEERTRALLAGELHDTVAQSLSAALIGSRSADPQERVEAHERLRDGEEQLRAVLARIRPPELVQGDLAQAVSDFCCDLFARYGVEVLVDWRASGQPLPSAVAVVVYRFVQESLLNAVEHADGVGLRLRLEVVETPAHPQLLVTVSDEGQGFDPQRVTSAGGRHLGLRLARERARLAGGALVVESAPGKGTTVLLSLPLVSCASVLPARATGPDGATDTGPEASDITDETTRTSRPAGSVSAGGPGRS